MPTNEWKKVNQNEKEEKTLESNTENEKKTSMGSILYRD